MNKTIDDNNQNHYKDEEIDLLQYFAVVIKRLKMIIIGTAIIVIIAIVYSLFATEYFKASTTFVSVEADKSLASLGALAGIAGTFGLSTKLGSESSPEFYAQLLKTREVIRPILIDSLFDSEKLGRKATLIEIYEIEGDNDLEVFEKGLEFFLDHMFLNVDNNTGILNLTLESIEPNLAADIANLLVIQLNKYNLKTRRSIAKEKFIFIEKRLEESESELLLSEDKLKIFLSKNRKFNSPELLFEQGRLQRQLEISQQIYLTVRKEFELARIEEIRDTPVINVLDKAEPPFEKSRPKRTIIVIVAGFLGLFANVFLSFFLEYFERLKKDDQDNRKIENIINDAKFQLRDLKASLLFKKR